MEFDNPSSPGVEPPPEYALVFRALSNPARLAVFQIVRGGVVPADGPSVCARDIARRLRLSPSLVSHHLRELRLAKLVRTERRGQRVQCSVNPLAFELLRRFTNEDPGRRPS